MPDTEVLLSGLEVGFLELVTPEVLVEFKMFVFLGRNEIMRHVGLFTPLPWPSLRCGRKRGCGTPIMRECDTASSRAVNYR